MTRAHFPSLMGSLSRLASVFTVFFTNVFSLLYMCISFFTNSPNARICLETNQYTPLDSDDSTSFRLVKLLKYKGPEIECELLPQPLSKDKHTPYEALSYTWGSSELVECIALDGKRFWVTENLHSALQYLRMHDRDRYLWIDAICINQTDRREKSQQVQQIGKVYNNAEKVLVWLGKATQEIADLMDALNHFRKTSTYRVPGQWPIDDSLWKTHRTGLLQLLDRPWFTRLWILQEAAHSQKADVCCGTRSIPAEIFTLAPSLIGETPAPHCEAVLEIMPGPSKSTSWWTQERDLGSLLRRFHTSKATNDRDKIYALLGMSSNPSDIQSIVIDYERPTNDIVHEAMTYLLQSQSSTPLIQSTPVAIYEVLDFMNSFVSLDTTYFVPAFMQEGAMETISPYFQSGNVPSKSEVSEYAFKGLAAFKDPALFVLDTRPERGHKYQETCYSQVVKLMSEVQARTTPKHQKYDDGLQVISWGSVEQHVKIVVVHDMRNAILKAAVRGYYQVVKQLLRISAGTDADEGWKRPALLEATEQEHTLAVQTLLSQSIEGNAGAGNYDGALLAASCKGSMKKLRLLLEVGVDASHG